MAFISILLPDLRGGGVERIRIVLAHEFVRAGHEVEFVLLQARGDLLAEAEADFTVISLDSPRLRNAPLRIAKYLRERRPDALLVGMWPLTFLAGAAARIAGNSVRLVASEHVDFRCTESHKRYERLALKHLGPLLYKPFHRVVAVSDGVADSLWATARLASDCVTVIHNPVRPLPSEEIGEADRYKLSGWLEGEARLIAIGGLRHQKGFDVLLHAMAELRKRVDARLLILGEGRLRSELEMLAAKLGLANALFLPGFRSNPGAFLSHADVFVLSSNWEGFGNVVVEALSAGVPVVSTDCPSGPAEILESGRYGALVPVGDYRALQKGINEALDFPLSSALLKQRASEFDPEKKAQLYLDLLVG